MRTYSHLLLASAALLGLASCSGDEPLNGIGDGTETFAVSLPTELTTRAFGDGESANRLYVAIYDADGAADAAPLFSNFPSGAKNGMEVTDFTNGKATVTVKLVKDKEYNIVLWAQNPEMTATEAENAFFYAPTARTIKVNYDNLVCNNENADAFYSYETYTSKGGDNTFTLHRPFAQINIGTDDLAKASDAGMPVDKAGMTVAGCADILNLTDGSASVSDGTEGVEANYAVQTLPNTETDGNFPANTTDKTYSYLTMGYVLVPGDKTAKGTADVSLNVPGQPQSPFATYPNVPVQGNFRTNIYGSLLTNPEVFTVTIEPAFNKPDNDEHQRPGYVYVSTAQEFNNAVTLGKNIILSNDIDLYDGVETTKSITIDTKGHTLTYYGAQSSGLVNTKGNTLILTGKGCFKNIPGKGSRAIINRGTLIIDNVSFDGSQELLNDGGVCTINGGTFSGSFSAIDNFGKLQINGGLFNCTQYGAIYNQSYGEVNVDGGTFTGSGYAVYSIQNNSNHSGNIAISGGTFTSATDIIYSHNNMNVTITGGTFVTPNKCLAVENSDLDISGGYFISTGGNAVSSSGATVISGGYFHSPANKATISAANPTVTGGYFSNLFTNDNLSETWTPAAGYVVSTLNPAHTETIDGTNYTFNYLVKAQ